jgi:hypothetical protein
VPRLHALRPGDSLRGVARHYGVTLGRLLARNPELCDPRTLVPGFVVLVPGLKGDSELPGGAGGPGAAPGSGDAVLPYAHLQLGHLALLTGGGGGGHGAFAGAPRRHSDSGGGAAPWGQLGAPGARAGAPAARGARASEPSFSPFTF